MRKGILLGVRCLEILRHLSYGPATARSIFVHFFKKEGANPKTRWRVMARRLEKFEREGLIRGVLSLQHKDTIYVLRKAAVPLVASRYGIEPNNVWIRFKLENLDHDLHVAAIARKLVRSFEGRLVFLDLECALRKDSKTRKGSYYPDIRLGVREETAIKIMAVEVDWGTVSKRDFLGKMNSFDGPILVIVPTRGRMELLMGYIETYRISKAVFITTSNDFFGYDFFEGPWRSNQAAGRVTLVFK